ncbi:MAG TPA: hypothetical protein VKE22_19830 [Haliangiales bacterium]|nr:hypothetical protein [Haliangiales bacterium]
MPRAVIVGVFVASVAGGACAAPSRAGLQFVQPAPYAGLALAVVGTWQVDDDSRTMMEVIDEGGAIRVRAWTPDDNVAYEVTEVSYAANHLKATFTYPTTKFVTKSDLELVDENTLEGPVTGAYEGYERWRRVKK